MVELKYLKEKNRKKDNLTKLKEDAKIQLEKYLEDKRMNQKENLKKFVIVFKGFEDYYVEELV